MQQDGRPGGHTIIAAVLADKQQRGEGLTDTERSYLEYTNQGHSGGWRYGALPDGSFGAFFDVNAGVASNVNQDGTDSTGSDYFDYMGANAGWTPEQVAKGKSRNAWAQGDQSQPWMYNRLKYNGHTGQLWTEADDRAAGANDPNSPWYSTPGVYQPAQETPQTFGAAIANESGSYDKGNVYDPNNALGNTFYNTLGYNQSDRIDQMNTPTPAAWPTDPTSNGPFVQPHPRGEGDVVHGTGDPRDNMANQPYALPGQNRGLSSYSQYSSPDVQHSLNPALAALGPAPSAQPTAGPAYSAMPPAPSYSASLTRTAHTANHGLPTPPPAPTPTPPKSGTTPPLNSGTAAPPTSSNPLDKYWQDYLNGYKPYQNNLGGLTEDALRSMLTNPSPYTSDRFMSDYNLGNAKISEDFGIRRQLDKEEMARRGAGDSTIAYGRLGDEGIKQSRAQADMTQNLMSEAAKAEGDWRSQSLQLAMQYGDQGLRAWQAMNQEQGSRLQGATGYDQQRFLQTLQTMLANHQISQDQLETYMRLAGY
jgi:hypothetical protein